MVYRKSTENDKEIIKELIELRFGNRDMYFVTENLDDRYLLAFDNDLLVAMTGLIDERYYSGPEIDWTCIRKEYEGKGIITSMIKEVIKDYNGDIYCSCWRLGNQDKINLYYQMKSLGFELVIKEHKKFIAEYNNCGHRCKENRTGNPKCYCYEDLYIKRFEGGK